MTLNTIASDLHVVCALLQKYAEEENLSYEQGLVLSSFYVSYKDTNAIIRYVQNQPEQNADQLLKDARLLHESALALLEVYEQNESVLLSFNPKPACDEHLQPFELQDQESQQKSVQLWRKYTELSNRLDYMSVDAPEFAELDKECDAAKEAYDTASAQTRQFSDRLQEEREKTASLYYFDMTCLEMLVLRLERIASSLISDLENLKKGGGV